MKKPSGKRLKLARTRSRHVILVGEHDPNRDQSRAIAELLAGEEGLVHTRYVEIPAGRHTAPDAEWLGKCLEPLDRAE